ncbi:hypothetical protein [Micromonospora chersina]|uniref:Major facilitator superfamily (MFS) profile domain-containing protein n=1 Tax=Micromonospora chersina TaxID=47854 RepID=A0A1C6UHM3_9ACTN|nr:hypothetical protein [Micromonospora chersina]SCL53353.1 hypothetical protein GA0070603_1581 [Micromonospora chersina]
MAEHSDPSREGSRDVRLHVLAVVIFGLLAWSGVVGLAQDAPALAVPSLIVGVAGAVRALSTVTGLLPAGGIARGVAGGATLLAAIAALTTGLVLAPDGTDRGFVLAVSAVLAAALAAYAVLGGPVRRPAGAS